MKNEDIFQFHSWVKNRKKYVCLIADSWVQKCSRAARIFSTCKVVTVVEVVAVAVAVVVVVVVVVVV